MGRGTKYFLAMVAAVCIAAAFLSPLFTSRAPLAHGKSFSASGYVLVAWAVLLVGDFSLMAQIRRVGKFMQRGNGTDLLALTCTRLC